MAMDVPRMDREELKKLLGQPEVQVIDLRHITQWAASDLKIAGAEWQNRDTVAEWVGKYRPDETLVLYCA